MPAFGTRHFSVDVDCVRWLDRTGPIGEKGQLLYVWARELASPPSRSRSLIALLGRKISFRFAQISILSPVRGLRPSRAATGSTE
jgi:hypothetical protein